MIVLLGERCENVVANTEVQGQLRREVPVVLSVDTWLPCLIDRRKQVVVARCRREDSLEQARGSGEERPGAFTLIILQVQRGTTDAAAAEAERVVAVAIDHAAVELVAVVFILQRHKITASTKTRETGRRSDSKARC